MMSEPLLKLSGIDKSFFGVRVLAQVSMQLASGRTLGLVGENGAGKSTLMNILGGNLGADAGTMQLSGESYSPQSPRDAAKNGIAYIHQELNLFSNLNIAENLFLTHFPHGPLGIDRKMMHQRASALLEQVGLKLPPTVRVEYLTAGEKQLVEIAKALDLDARLIILDEPTTSLSGRETDRLFELFHSLKARGIAMIYISHALNDIQRLCDDFLILRDGQVVGSGPIGDFNLDRTVSLMVGREISQQFPIRTSQATLQTTLEVSRVSQPGVVDDISFSLHQGEVLGIGGLMGSGRTELARILYGLAPMETGAIKLAGHSIEGLSTRERIKRGMAMLTESRREDGLCMQQSIFDNMAMVCAPNYASRPTGLLRIAKLRRAVNAMRESVRLTKTAANNQQVQTLSGGNQQKVVLGKWLLNKPQLLILDEPTRGIDVGAKYEIYSLIDQLGAGGAAILVISSEIEELIGLCDRIIVMGEGRVRDEMSRKEFDAERILRAALRSSKRTGEAMH